MLPECGPAVTSPDRRMLAHAATREGIVAVNNMFGGKDRIRYQAIPAGDLHAPRSGLGGPDGRGAQDPGIEYKKSVVPMAVAGRFLVENEGGTGMVKVLVGAKYGEMLGVHAIGDGSQRVHRRGRRHGGNRDVRGGCERDCVSASHRIGSVAERPFPESTDYGVQECPNQSSSNRKGFRQGDDPFLRYPDQRLSKTRRRSWAVHHRGFPGHLAGHVRDPRVRNHPERDQDQGRVPGRRVQPRRTGASVDRAGSGGRGHGVLADARRPHLRLASQPRRDSGQGIFRHPPARATQQLLEHHGSRIATARCSRPVEKGYRGPCRAWRMRFFVYGAYSEIFARETGLQPRAGRLDARVLHAVRNLSQQRHRGRLGLHRARRGAVSSESTASRASWSATSATPRSAAVRCGKASRSPPWTSTASCGTRRSAAACRSFSTA